MGKRARAQGRIDPVLWFFQEGYDIEGTFGKEFEVKKEVEGRTRESDSVRN